jgi:uncharacterized protein YlxW (UPF0749 family)
MGKWNAKVSIGTIFLILGVMLSVQVRSVLKINQASNKQQKNLQDISTSLALAEKENREISAQLKDREQKLSNYEKSASKNNALINIMKSDLDNIKTMAGLVDVRGKGVTVTIDDSKSNDPNSDALDLVAHDFTLLEVVNDLRASGAECISINDERLVATSEIRCAGTLIDINNVRIGPPFVIKAVGDSDILYAGLMLKGGIYDSLTLPPNNLQVSIKKEDNLLLKKYNGNYKSKFAKPVM